MKKVLLSLLNAAIGAAIGILIFVLITGTGANGNSTKYMVNEAGTISSDSLAQLAFQVASTIKSGDYDKLSDFVHPDYGIVFSPYATVSLSSNRWFTADQVADFDKNSEQYVWGLTNDGGEPMQMSVSDYFSRYVFNYDYTLAPLVGINYIVRSGNSVENIMDAFPGSQFVDLCYPGSSESENQDWSTLRLVFENYNGQLMLTAIIHSEYTI